jgi:hypothetical protein
MISSVGTQTETRDSRTVVESFEREFALLDSRTRELVQKIPDGILYQPITELNSGAISVGGLILRSAAAVEQTCGGLTANLWDDPFEWTLPETLSTSARVNEYLDEVAQTRDNFFARLKDDSDLTKLIAVPSGDTQPMARVLTETLVRGAGYLERAAVILATATNAESQ